MTESPLREELRSPAGQTELAVRLEHQDRQRRDHGFRQRGEIEERCSSMASPCLVRVADAVKCSRDPSSRNIKRGSGIQPVRKAFIHHSQAADSRSESKPLGIFVVLMSAGSLSSHVRIT